ncbi:hypothetical protein DPMN_035158 [Dreissena polymorpha]|uniref:Uncharacterized protein n=1 Tax=Dreissena polymorpha TaxID=45954 RepID=A0A9D4M867_DREPO|nr:hypothetical protein DPMN_035158 [Dreissena polymorpha]
MDRQYLISLNPARSEPTALPARYISQCESLSCCRCGDQFHGRHFCKALSIMCYKSRNYGHYAGCCKTTRLHQNKPTPEFRILNTNQVNCVMQS